MPSPESRTLEHAEQKLSPITEITGEQELQEFFQTIFRNNFRYTTNDPDADTYHIKRMANEAAQTAGKSDHFLVIKDVNNKTIATGKIAIEGQRGYLSKQTVDQEYRQKGLGKKLTDRRIAIAEEAGCTEIGTGIYTNNPISLVAKFKDNFQIVGVDIYEKENDIPTIGEYIVVRPIKETEEKYTFQEKRQVPLNDVPAIQKLLNERWVGTGIKKIGEGLDEDLTIWELTLEK